MQEIYAAYGKLLKEFPNTDCSEWQPCDEREVADQSQATEEVQAEINMRISS